MADDRIEIEIALDDGKVLKGLAKIKDEGQKTGDGLESSFSRAGKGLAALAASYFAVSSIKNFFGIAISQAAEAEVNLNKLNTAMRLAGTFSQEASQKFQDMATEIQRTTTIEDDAVLSLAALARNLTTTNEQAMKLTKAAIELGAATGMSADTALMQLNGTLSGTAGRLTKIIPDLKNFTEEQLRSGAAIDFVNERFRGAAAAEVNTYAGSLKRLSNLWGDLLENIGRYVTQSRSISVVINAVGDVVSALGDSIQMSFGNKDIFKNLIIDFAVVLQAGTETARRIGLSFELAWLRAQQAWAGYKVLTTAGFSDSFNSELMAVNQRIDEVKNRFSQDSGATQFFDNLILKLSETKGKLDQTSGRDGTGGGVAGLKEELVSVYSTLPALSGAFDAVSESFDVFADAFQTTAMTIANDAKKLVAEAGGNAFRSLANGVASGMGAIGKALVTGDDIFKAFAGAMLSALGQAALQMGATYFLIGLAGTLTGAPNGPALMGVGSALSVLGGALMALGQGASGGPSRPTVSSGADPGGYVGGLPANENPAEAEPEEKKARVTVNIQGDVLDSRESGLRIIEMINDAGFAAGGKVFA